MILCHIQACVHAMQHKGSQSMELHQGHGRHADDYACLQPAAELPAARVNPWLQTSAVISMPAMTLVQLHALATLALHGLHTAPAGELKQAATLTLQPSE